MNFLNKMMAVISPKGKSPVETMPILLFQATWASSGGSWSKVPSWSWGASEPIGNATSDIWYILSLFDTIWSWIYSWKTVKWKKIWRKQPPIFTTLSNYSPCWPFHLALRARHCALFALQISQNSQIGRTVGILWVVIEPTPEGCQMRIQNWYSGFTCWSSWLDFTVVIAMRVKICLWNQDNHLTYL